MKSEKGLLTAALFSLLSLIGSIPVFGEPVELPAAELDRISAFFAGLPAKITYDEDQEYYLLSPFGVTNHLVLRLRKTEAGGEILHQDYLEGETYEGKAAGGGIQIYNFKYPFRDGERHKYRFLKKSDDVILVLPRVREEGILTAELRLKNGRPHLMRLYPAYIFPNLSFYRKEVQFDFVGKRMVEKYLEFHGSFQVMPFYRRASRYRVLRFNFQF